MKLIHIAIALAITFYESLSLYKFGFRIKSVIPKLGMSMSAKLEKLDLLPIKRISGEV